MRQTTEALREEIRLIREQILKSLKWVDDEIRPILEEPTTSKEDLPAQQEAIRLYYILNTLECLTAI